MNKIFYKTPKAYLKYNIIIPNASFYIKNTYHFAYIIIT